MLGSLIIFANLGDNFSYQRKIIRKLFTIFSQPEKKLTLRCLPLVLGFRLSDMLFSAIHSWACARQVEITNSKYPWSKSGRAFTEVISRKCCNNSSVKKIKTKKVEEIFYSWITPVKGEKSKSSLQVTIFTWNAQAAHWKWVQAIFNPSSVVRSSATPSWVWSTPMLYNVVVNSDLKSIFLEFEDDIKSFL